MPTGFIPDKEPLTGFVPDKESLTGFVPDPETQSGFVPDELPVEDRAKNFVFPKSADIQGGLDEKYGLDEIIDKVQGPSANQQPIDQPTVEDPLLAPTGGGGGSFLGTIPEAVESEKEYKFGFGAEDPLYQKVAKPLAELYVKEGATAIKFQQLKAWDMPESEALEKSEKWDWPEMFLWHFGHNPDDPEFSSPNSAFWNTLATQLVGETSSAITKPSTWITWGVAQAAFPAVASVVARKLPRLAAALETPVGKLASKEASKAISEVQASQAASRLAEGGINLKGVLKGQNPATQKLTLQHVVKQLAASRPQAESGAGMLMRRALNATGRFSAEQVDDLVRGAVARRLSPQSFKTFMERAIRQGQAPIAKEIAANLAKSGKITQKSVMQLRMFAQAFPEEAAGLIGAELGKLVPEAEIEPPSGFVPDVAEPTEVPSEPTLPAVSEPVGDIEGEIGVETPQEPEVALRDAEGVSGEITPVEGGFVPETPTEAPKGFVADTTKEIIAEPLKVSVGLGKSGEAINPAFAVHEIGKGATETMRNIVDPIKQELEPTAYTPQNYQDTFRKLIGERNVGYERIDTMGLRIKEFVGKDAELDRAILLYQQYGDSPEFVVRNLGKLPEGPMKKALERMLRLTPTEKAFAEGIRAHFDEVGKFAVDAGVLNELRPGYAPGYWMPKEGAIKKLGRVAMRSWKEGKLRTTTRHAKGKVYEGYIEGVLAGERPVTLRASEIVPKYSREMLNTMTARSFVGKLKNMVMEDGRRALEYEFRKGHEDYVPVNHPALRKHKYITTDAKGKPVLHRVPLVAHPDIAKALNNFLAPSAFDENAILKFVKKINLMQKLGKVRLGFFHWNALSRQAIQFGVSPTSYKGGVKLIMDQDPVVEDLVRIGGMTLSGGEMADYADSFFKEIEDTALETAETAPESVKKAIKGVIRKWDKALWHDFFRGLKAYTGKVEFARNLDRYPKKSRDEVLKITGEDMNRVYGGLNYELMGRFRTMQDVLRVLLFAPDWTESNWRGWGRALSWGGGKGMRRMIVRGLLLFGAAHITLNKVLSGHYPWENEKGHKWNTDLGFTTPDGRKMYWNIYGHTIEPIKALKNPMRWVKGKQGLFLREVTTQIEGKDWRNRPFAQFEDLMDGYLTGPPQARPEGLEHLETIPARGVHAIRSAVPIPMDAMLMWMTGQEEFPAIIDDLIGERMSRGPKGGEIVTEIRDVSRDIDIKRFRAMRKARDQVKDGNYEEAIQALIRGEYSDPQETLKNLIRFEEATAARMLQTMTKLEKRKFVEKQVEK